MTSCKGFLKDHITAWYGADDHALMFGFIYTHRRTNDN